MKSILLSPGDVTAIGSWPHDDLDHALTDILERLPALPAAPSLPNRCAAEYLVAQGLAGVKGVTVRTDGTFTVDVDELDPFDPLHDVLPDSSWSSTLRFFDAVSDRAGPIKFQVPGPVTVGVALVQAGVPADLAFAVSGTASRQRTAALVAEAMTRAPMATQVVFVDEPSMPAAHSADAPLTPDHAIDLVSTTLAAAEPHAVTGFHCCGDLDWRLAQQAGPQILSMPVDDNVVDDAETIALHLERGGWIAWGAIPTDGPISAGPDVPWKHLGNIWCSLVSRGCDGVALRERALITPACGLGHHTLDQAAHIIELAAELGRRVQTQAFGLRLTVGA